MVEMKGLMAGWTWDMQEKESSCSVFWLGGPHKMEYGFTKTVNS